MITRRSAAAGALALGAATVLPGVANAAPVQPRAAIVSAGELPAGSSGYTLSTKVAQPPTKPARDTPCDRMAHRIETALAGSTTVEVSATRGTDEIHVGISEGSGVSTARDVITACNTDPGVVPQATVGAPSDLARLAPFITRTRDGKLLQATIDLRGVSVTVYVVNMDRSVDSSIFWQVLRAQVAKVERQP